MRISKILFALIALWLFCPAAAHANATPVSDILANQCRQLESAHGPTQEFPNTFYTNLVFQCATRPGTAPAGVVFKEIERYAKDLARADSRPGSRCEVTQADGGANIVTQGPMEPSEPSASKDVVVSYNAKYACLSPQAARGLDHYRVSSVSPGVNFAAVPYSEPTDYQTNYHRDYGVAVDQVSYVPPRRSWVARDEAYNSRSHYHGYYARKAYYHHHWHRHYSIQKAVYRPVHARRHHHVSKTSLHAKDKDVIVQKVKVEVMKVAPTPMPASTAAPQTVIIQGGPAPTSPLPGFNSP